MLRLDKSLCQDELYLINAGSGYLAPSLWRAPGFAPDDTRIHDRVGSSEKPKGLEIGGYTVFGKMRWG